MLEKLLGSESRVKILTLFLLNAGTEYYLREIAQRTGLAVRSVQRTVMDLTDIAILHRERRGNSVYFRLNIENPIVPDLKAMFLKTVGLGDLLRETLAGESKIEAAFIYGSVAKGDETATSDIDLAMIGDVPPQTLTGLLEDLERVTGRDVNATVFTRAEWGSRAASGEHFVTTLLREPKIMLLGFDVELGALGRVADA
ncbi:nucleotidyltransferase domain-containing protein [Candidatus Bipolaricaulota bacterium]|nr:nucleotidyltransferase domain-containing protein [Candidatus Bipolaricaulota bacterium]